MERKDKDGAVEGPRGAEPSDAVAREADAADAETTEAEATETAVESAEAQADGVPYDDEIADELDEAQRGKSGKREPKNRAAEG